MQGANTHTAPGHMLNNNRLHDMISRQQQQQLDPIMGFFTPQRWLYVSAFYFVKFWGFGGLKGLGQGNLVYWGAAEGGELKQNGDFRANIAQNRSFYQFSVVLADGQDRGNRILGLWEAGRRQRKNNTAICP